MKINIKLSQFIVICGVCGMMFGLISSSMPSLMKGFVFLFSLFVTVIGVLLETPVLEHLNDRPNKEEEFV